MRTHKRARRSLSLLLLAVFVALIVSACNLSGSSDEDSAETIEVPTTVGNTLVPTFTPAGDDNDAPTPLPIPTQRPFATSTPRPIAVLPTQANTPLPISIFILSPIPGNIVSGNVQVIGSATHPQFLQYQLEYGPDPNPNNLWFPIATARQNPVINNLLGVWNTQSGGTPDGLYQLRLRVFLQNGSDGGTVVVNNIRVQNQAPTPQPTNTATVERPIAAFSQNTSIGNAPLAVQFTNQSIGQNMTFNWNFGDGTSSTLTNPSHTFSTPGTYTVVLTATNSGGSSNVSRQITVQSVNPPVAVFTQDRTSGEAPLTVQFTDQSTGGEVTTWEWNFGDGGTSFARNPSHTFQDAGNFNVILTVRGPGGSSFATRQITVTSPIDPPVASFLPNQPVSGPAPLSIDFENTTTGEVTEYAWNFGDGSLITVQENPSYTYTVPGNYTVTLSASGPGGNSSATLDVSVSAELSADFTSTPNQQNPLEVAFNAQALGGTGDYTYSWNFGSADVPASTVEDPTVTYAAGGVYDVTLTVNDGEDDTVVIRSVEVTEPTPDLAADFNAIPNPQSPLEVSFVSQVSGGTGDYEYFWDFGDASQTSTQANPTITYGAASTYNVTLRIRDGNDEVFVTESVAVQTQLAADFVFTPSPANPLEVSFTSQVSGGTGNYTYTWDFGRPDMSASTDANPTATYPSGGSYNVRLTVDDGENQVITEEVIEVQTELAGSFTATEVNPLEISFASDVSGGTGDYTYSWDFGSADVPDSSEASPTVTYPAGGTYTVVLTVSDGESQVTPSQQIVVTEPTPDLTASFMATEINPLEVSFAADVSGGTGSYTYNWTFGDGQTSTEANPTVIYATGGTYPVSLTVNDGQTNVVAEDTVSVMEPLAVDFTFNVSDQNNLEVTFTAQPSGGTGNYTYAWNFDNGQTSTEAIATTLYPTGGTYQVSLTVNDGQNELQAVKPITVEDNLAPLEVQFTYTENDQVPFQANFSAQPLGGTGNYTYSWAFGDGQTSTEANPSHVYAQAGTYNATLTVNDGVSDASTTRQVIITEPAQPLTADFTADVDANDSLTFNITSNVAGGTGEYIYSWDFGDGQTSDQPNPTVTYASAGTYTINLTVNDGANAVIAMQDVEAIGGGVTVSPIVLNTPELPALGQEPLRSRINAIWNAGLSAGRNPLAFAVIGDETADSSNFLDPFATPGQDYTDPSADFLDSIITAYNSADIGAGDNSFNRDSVAVGSFTLDQLLNQSEACDGGRSTTRVQCEIDTINPTIAIVSVGYNDIINGTDPAQFQSQLEGLLQSIVDNNVLPVVTTVYPVPGSEQQASDINEAIIQAAEAVNVPVVNMWRVFDDLGDDGLDANGNPTVDANGPGFVAAGNIITAGANLRNAYIITVLNDIGDNLN